MLVTQTSFREGTSGDLAKCRLFSQATGNHDLLKLNLFSLGKAGGGGGVRDYQSPVNSSEFLVFWVPINRLPPKKQKPLECKYLNKRLLIKYRLVFHMFVFCACRRLVPSLLCIPFFIAKKIDTSACCGIGRKNRHNL